MTHKTLPQRDYSTHNTRCCTSVLARCKQQVGHQDLNRQFVAVVVVRIYAPVTGQRQTLIVKWFAHFSLQSLLLRHWRIPHPSGPSRGPISSRGGPSKRYWEISVWSLKTFFSFGDHLISTGKTVRISVKTFFFFWDHIIFRTKL